MEKKKCLIVYNPTSGHAISEEILSIYKEKLREHGYEVIVRATKAAHDATRIVQEEKNIDLVFAVGGDGTLNEVISGNCLREKKVPVCPISAGTCNDVASMLGYGTDPIENLEKALEGEVCDMDIGIINDNPFAYVVGMGKFMNVPYETKGEEKRKRGYLAYMKAALPEVIKKIKRYKVEALIDGERRDGEYSLIMVSNSSHIAGVDNFHKNVCLDDGYMEILLCKAKNRREFVQSFASYLIRGKSKNIISLQGHDVEIKFVDSEDRPWCIDGESLKREDGTYNIRVGEKVPMVAALKDTPKVKKLFKTKTGKAY